MPQDNMLIKTTLLHDQPIRPDYQESDDGLGFHAYAKILAGAALGTPGPFTIGVFGEWGTGKTSLLQMVKGLLDAQKDEAVVTVWFDAWLHEQDEHPLVPLVATILQSLEPHKELLAKLKDGGKSLLNALLALAHGFSVKVKQPDVAGYELEVGVSVPDAKEAWDKLKEDPLLKQNLHSQAFDRLSDLALGDKLKIVVLIDDLDRCMPDRAIKLLESIKLVLSQPGFIFMLGVSRRVIQGYLEHRYTKEYGIADFPGGAYLDKIVQLPFPIPPHSGRMEQFSANLLSRLQPSDREALEDILPLIGAACGNNPRATVRFVNNLLIDKAINRTLAQQGLMKAIDMPFFAITRALQQRWQPIFDLLVRDPKLCERIAKSEESDQGSLDLEEGSVEAQAFSMLTDPDLRALLYSEHGKKWLAEGETRTAAIQFLQTQRQESDSVPSGPDVLRILCNTSHYDAAQRIREILLPLVPFRIEVGSVLLEQNVAEGIVLWIVGSDWQTWERFERVRDMSQLWARNIFFLLLLPEAKQSTLPDRVPADLAMSIPDYPVSEANLAPLIRALQRLPRKSPTDPEIRSFFGQDDPKRGII